MNYCRMCMYTCLCVYEYSFACLCVRVLLSCPHACACLPFSPPYGVSPSCICQVTWFKFNSIIVIHELSICLQVVQCYKEKQVNGYCCNKWLVFISVSEVCRSILTEKRSESPAWGEAGRKWGGRGRGPCLFLFLLDWASQCQSALGEIRLGEARH